MSEEDDGKWECHVCTYSNWSSSIKCTMCLSKRSGRADDIYRLQSSENICKASGARAVTPEQSTWACSLCTFHNTEKTSYCLQCDTPRRNIRSPKNTNIAAENSKINLINDRYSNVDKDEFDYNYKKISKSNSQNLGFSSAERVSIIKSNSQHIIESSYYHSNNKNLDIRSPEKSNRDRERNFNSTDVIDSNILAESIERSPSSRNIKLQRNLSKKPLEEIDNINEIAKAKSNINAAKGDIPSCSKWTCHHCTYDNWPKAGKCVMCGLGRNPAPERSSPVNLESPDCDNARGLPQALNEDNFYTSLRRYASEAGTNSISNYFIYRSNSRRFEPIDSVTARRQLSPNNCDMERKLRLSRQTDWSWLEACKGVVDGDPHPVEAYLRSGGDPARFLTPNEVTVLNRPSAFDAGHTLVHLAIR